MDEAMLPCGVWIQKEPERHGCGDDHRADLAEEARARAPRHASDDARLRDAVRGHLEHERQRPTHAPFSTVLPITIDAKNPARIPAEYKQTNTAPWNSAPW